MISPDFWKQISQIKSATMEQLAVGWILAILVSVGVGAISGLFGIGGGFLLVPILTSVLGIPIQMAVGSTVSFVLGPSTTSLMYRRTHWQEWRSPISLLGGLFLGVLLGANALNQLVGRQIPSLDAETFVLAVYLVLLTILGSFSLWESERAARHRAIPRGWLNTARFPPLQYPEELGGQRISLPVFAWFGVVVGFFSGFLGISGGLLLVPGFLYLFDVPARKTVTNATIIVWLTSCQSTLMHAWTGNIDLWLVVALLSGGTLGSRIGAQLGRRLGSQQYRRNFGILTLSAAVFIAFHLMRSLFQ